MAHEGRYVPAFTGDIPTINIDKFSANVYQVAEQMEADVFPLIEPDDDFGGQDLFIDIMAKLDGATQTDTNPNTSTPPFRNASDGTGAYQPSARYVHTAWRYGVWAKRLLIAQEWQLPLVRERSDVKRINDDIDSKYVQEAGFDLARRMDKIAYAAMDATVVEYAKTASASDAINPGTGTNKTLAAHSDVDSNSSVIADNGEGLTISKLQTMDKRFDRRDVRRGGRILWATTNQKHDLLVDSKVQNIDTNIVKALVDGEVDTYMGFRFIWNNIPTASAGIRKCFAFHLSGLVSGIEESIFISDDILPDWNFMKQIYMAMNLGVVRMDENKVIQVNCLESS